MRFGLFNYPAKLVFQPALATLFAFATLVVVGSGDASAQYKAKVKAGTQTRIDVIGTYERQNCTSVLTRPKSDRGKAENGTVRLAWEYGTISQGACKGRRLRVIGVYYTPKRGFRGKDKVSVTFQAPRAMSSQSSRNANRRRNYIVTVQ